MASYERTEIPSGLSASDARRLVGSPPPVTSRRPPNRKAVRGVVFAGIGLSCAASLTLNPRVAVGLFDPAEVAIDVAMAVTAGALTGLLFGALAIVDGIYGWLEARAGGGGRRLPVVAVALGVLTLLVFFRSFYFPITG